jgi:hypothetical protein
MGNLQLVHLLLLEVAMETFGLNIHRSLNG